MDGTELKFFDPQQNLQFTTEMTVEYRSYVALECLKAMLINPATAQMDFATTADFALRQADAFILELNKPQV